MEHKFKFEKLIIWQKAMGFGEDINTLAEHFPKKELFNLASQICRASDSIALNISEGSIGQSVAEQKNLPDMPFDRLLKWSHVCIKQKEEDTLISVCLTKNIPNLFT